MTMSSYLDTSMCQELKDVTHNIARYSSNDRLVNKATENKDFSNSPSSDIRNTSILSCRKGPIDNVPVESPNAIGKEIAVADPVCIQLDSILKLKESTRKLLCLLEEIQLKTHSKHLKSDGAPRLLNLLKPIPPSTSLPSVTDLLGANALKQLEVKTSTLEGIYIKDDDDDCSIHKRLTRKCNCLNRAEFNDFVIHFNEETKYFTNTIGELIKNMRIVKKFLYMNGDYTKHALLFLNEGFAHSTYTEKVDIIQGIAYADMCNVFDDYSIVIVYISWPCKYDNYGDATMQALTATFLHRLAQVEEGRRYLNLSTKISNDIKKIIRKSGSKIDFETLETLNAVLNILQPPLYQNVNATYYCKPIDEDYLGSRTINILGHNRKHMTLDEVFTNLELLNSYSTREAGKIELTSYLPALLTLFKNMLLEYDNSAMNIVITNVLNNIVSKNMVKEKELDLPKTVIIADTATETIAMKNEYNQIPAKKNVRKTKNKSKAGLGLSPNKLRNPSKRKVSNWESSLLDTHSKKQVHQNYLRSSIIVVPVERE